MRIAFIYDGDSTNPDVFSGIPYNLYTYLKKHFSDVVLITPVISSGSIYIKYLSKIVCRVCSFLSGKTCFNYYLKYSARKMADDIDRRLSEANVDLIISPGVDPFIYSKNSIPLILITGGTVRLLRNDYDNKDKWSRKYYNWLENRSIRGTEKAFRIICASTYCAESLINDYNIESNKIVTIPYGTNLQSSGKNIRSISPDDQINFLFIGKEWARKGGEDTVLLCDILISMGINIKLTVVGTVVPKVFDREYIVNYAYLNKKNEQESELLVKLFTESHFLIVPTKAEFFGIVFSEAASFSLPVISRKTGPVPEIVIDNQTGILIEREPDLLHEAKRLYEIINDNARYQLLCEKSYKRYLEVLNWDSYMIKLKEVISSGFK